MNGDLTKDFSMKGEKGPFEIVLKKFPDVFLKKFEVMFRKFQGVFQKILSTFSKSFQTFFQNILRSCSKSFQQVSKFWGWSQWKVNRDLTKQFSMKGEIGPYHRTFNERWLETLPKNFQWMVNWDFTQELSMKV